MSRQTILSKSDGIRNETGPSKNTGSRVAAVLDDIAQSFVPMEGVNPLTEKITGPLYQSNIGINDPLNASEDYKMYTGKLYQNYIESAEIKYVNPNNSDTHIVTKRLNYFGSTMSSHVTGASGYSLITTQTTVNVINNPVHMAELSSNVNNQYKSGIFKMDLTGISLNFQSGVKNTVINLNENGLRVSGIANAQGDPFFTRQLVQKSDGTVGWENKQNTEPVLPYVPMVTIISFDASDPTYLIMKMMVTGVVGPITSPYFDIWIHTGVANDLKAQNVETFGQTLDASATLPGNMVSATSFIINVRFPKATNTSPLWTNTS